MYPKPGKRKKKAQSRKIRDSARGEDCTVCIPGICNGNPETTVLDHLPGGGMGAKRLDIHGAYACSNCHDAIDHRVMVRLSNNEIDLMHYQAVIRTQEILWNKGLIHD